MRDFNKPFALYLAGGVVLGEVITALRLANEQGYLLFVVSECAARDRLLIDGDAAAIFGPVIGG
jgi:hypothetical protein